MKRTSYRELDYAFGQLMLSLRTVMGLTQTDLANSLGVSRQSVAEWESGSKYPKAERLRSFIALAFQHRALSAGQEADEIRALWKAAHQKLPLDEAWLTTLLESQTHEDRRLAPPSLAGTHIDWDNATSVQNFYGREWELKILMQWVIEERCKIISVLGIGGIGKSSLSVNFMHQVADQFEVVIWRSLRDAPTCDALLDDLIQALAPSVDKGRMSIQQRLDMLLGHLRQQRTLIVLDNAETLMEEGTGAGQLRPGYENYSLLLRYLAGGNHQSSLLLTSREKPVSLVALEGGSSSVRSLRLVRLDNHACEQLLAEKGVRGSPIERIRLIEAYTGNPLALKIVTQTIVDLFGGEIAAFLEQGELIFGGVRALLTQQFARLSSLEQTILLWLAILREPSTMTELLSVLVKPVPRGRLLEALEALYRRSLIERGQAPGSFTLQSVVMEYFIDRLISEVVDEIQSQTPAYLIEHGLELAQAREYVRETQERLIIAPILALLRNLYVDDLEQHLLTQLAVFAQVNDHGYGPANLVTLLRSHKGHLRGLNLQGLTLRAVYLQGVEMQDTNLSATTILDSVLTEAFDAVLSVAISSTGEYWAASNRRGEIQLWSGQGRILHRAWRAHMDMVWTLTFSADSRLLATGSWDKSIKVWDVATGSLLWTGWHTGEVVRIAFSADDRLLASNGGTEIILWDSHQGTMLNKLPQRATPTGIAWSGDGRFLASSDVEGNVQIWSLQQHGQTTHLRSIVGSPVAIPMLDFSPDSTLLVGACMDGPVRLWEVESGRLLHSFEGHTDLVRRVTWSPDGHTIASASRDQTIRLWDFEKKYCRSVLRGHEGEVCGLAFSPDSRNLLTTSIDGTMRVWDTLSSQCTRITVSYATTIFDIDWSPDSSQLISGGMNIPITIWDVSGRTSPQAFNTASTIICSLGWSPDGQYVATSEWNHAIRLWDPAARTEIAVLQPPDDNGNIFYNLAWSPDGQRLAWGTYDDAVRVYDISTCGYRSISQNFPTRLRHVAWSPDGKYLAGCGYNGMIYVWDSQDLRLVQQIAGHTGIIMCIAWHSDSTRLAAGGHSAGGGELFVWNIQRAEHEAAMTHVEQPEVAITYMEQAVSAVIWDSDGEILMIGSPDGRLRWWHLGRGEFVDMREAHAATIQTLRRSPDGQMLASCGNDGAVMLWNLQTRQHLQTLRRDRPYERMDITGIRGLTEAQKASLRTLGAIEQ